MDESKEGMMEATFRALSEQGYADLSIQNIADESDKAKSAIYYHFDDKEDLLLEFMEFLKENIEEMHEGLDGMPPEQKMEELLDMTLGIKDEERWMVQRALLDLKAQAPRNELFAAKFREIDEMVLENIEEILMELDADEPEMAAEIFVSCIEGAVNRKVAAGDRQGLEKLKNWIRNMLDECIEV
jgi:AcrR family transcriptional regulator